MRVSNGYPMGAKFIGEEGVAHVSRGGLSTEPASLAESEVAPDEIHLYESVNHSRNFVDCVRSRAETITPIEVAHRAITIAHLGNIAMRLERPVRWDPEAEVIVNDPQAQRMTDRAMRGGWHL
jgi:hypothetical protein